jgi:hypothetical protein
VTGNAALLKNGLDVALKINLLRGSGLSGKSRIYGKQNYPHEPVSPYRHAGILPELYSRAIPYASPFRGKPMPKPDERK